MEEQEQPTGKQSDEPTPKGDGPEPKKRPRKRKADQADGNNRRNQRARARVKAARDEDAATDQATQSGPTDTTMQRRAHEVRPVAEPARMKRRHWGVILSLLLLVCAPSGMTWWYLEERATDQYASTIGFSVRKEEMGSAVEVLGGITGMSSDSSKDTDILYEFIQSQKIVELIDKRLNLRALYTVPYHHDPIFALKPDASIEELVAYWDRMVKIFYDGGNGLLEIRVNAFDPQDAQTIAQAIFEESSLMINRLSAIAREDATRYAKIELDDAVQRLKETRQAITEFRNRAQIVDPNADIQSQMGLLNTLQQQLASALIELDLLKETTRLTDPRIEQASRKIAVIEARIADERNKFSIGGSGGGEAFATLVSEYEGLQVEREFAEQSYLAAQSAFNGARAEAQRQSRYLAAFVEPTLAETAQYPQRLTLWGLVTLFLLVIWSILVLVYYSIKDRR